MTTRPCPLLVHALSACGGALSACGDALSLALPSRFSHALPSLRWQLIRRNIVDESTIAAVRRQFRELVKVEVSEVPIEGRVFDSRLLFNEALRRGQIKQRAEKIPKGTMIDGGKTTHSAYAIMAPAREMRKTRRRP